MATTRRSTDIIVDLDSVIDFSKLTLLERSQVLDKIFEGQKNLGIKEQNEFIRILFLTEVNRVYLTKRDDILWKLKDLMTGREIIDAIVSFFKEICFGNSQMYCLKMFVYYLKAKAVCDWKEKNSYLKVVKWGESICNDKLVDIFADEHKNCLSAQVY